MPDKRRISSAKKKTPQGATPARAFSIVTIATQNVFQMVMMSVASATVLLCLVIATKWF